MKNKKIVLLIFIFICIILSTTPVFASSLLKNIEVVVNNISLFVNDNQVSVDNFVYNGTTYVPVRAIAETLGLSVNWDSKTNKVDLNSDSLGKLNKTTDGKYLIVNESVQSLIFDCYYLWNFMDIAFDKNIKSLDNSFKVYLTDMLGNKIETRYQRGLTKFNNLLIIPEDKLKLNTYYNLYIPKGEVIMENGDLYGEEILIQFKTPTNVLKGKISSNTKLFGNQMTIKNSDNEYTAMIKGNNEFVFINITSGNYDVIINEELCGKILVEDNKINNSTIYFTQKDNKR